MSATKKIVFITGGNNGIGLAACTLFSAQPNYHCIMASRSLDKGQKALASIQSLNSSSDISLVQLDITSDDSIAAAVEEVKVTWMFSSTTPVLVFQISPGKPFTVVWTPMLSRPPCDPRVIYVSSQTASITCRSDPKDIGYDAPLKTYRVSKAALNMIVACDAWEYKDKMKVFSFCPGYVITDLSGNREKKIKEGVAKSPDGSATGLLNIADGKRDEENGMFLHDEKVGELHPW